MINETTRSAIAPGAGDLFIWISKDARTESKRANERVPGLHHQPECGRRSPSQWVGPSSFPPVMNARHSTATAEPRRRIGQCF